MPLTHQEIHTLLAGMPGWSFENDALTRQFTFPSFPDAIAFTTRLAFDAESHDHHPDLTISYKKVTVVWSTHSEHGVTDKDVAGARQSDVFARMFGAR